MTSVYADVISASLKAAGRAAFTDRATIALVENWMRAETRGYLDHLDMTALASCANLQLEAMLTSPELVRLTARAERLEVPAWATDPQIVTIERPMNR